MSTDVLTALIVGVLGLFGGGTLIALLKLPRGSAVIELTEKAYVIQAGVIDDLNKEMARLQRRVAELSEELRAARTAAAQIAELRNRVDVLQAENEALTRARNALRRRVHHLEEEVKALQNGGSHA